VPLEADYGGYHALDAAGYQFALDYGAASFDRIGFTEVLEGRFTPDRVSGRIALIGSHAKRLPDDFGVPFGRDMAGVEIHAQMVDQLIRSAEGTAFPRRALSEVAEIAMLFLASVLGAAASLVFARGAVAGFTVGVGTTIVGLLVLGVAAVVTFAAGGWMPVVAPSLARVSSVGIVNIWISSRERGQRAEVMRLFSHSVSPRVADEIWEHFVDMKGYSGSVSVLEPDALLEQVGIAISRP
jgi:adenylate cyclase